MQDREWEIAARRAERPVALHFAVCPHSPAHGALLNENGHPVLTNYSDVDWKGLATSAHAAIEGYVPKSVKLFIADDAVDVMDVLEISTDTGRPFRGVEGFETRLRTTLRRLSMQDMRAGIIKLAGNYPDLHINTPIEGKRPPLGAMIVSLKFTSGLQLIDYVGDATHCLFGSPAIVANFDGFQPKPTTGEMPSFLAGWLRSQFGVVYGTDCTALVVARTFTD
ncbi:MULTISPECIES: hypothetical protein [unclassified Pseudomonas]|uniref:hypothetical protein n=1 Tax=unclassified Pseudomonas TaxID=196821 RepID=UPI001CBB2AB8|nr:MULTISPECIES: hypothetical protein [unclassified Pseudomonas]